MYDQIQKGHIDMTLLEKRLSATGFNFIKRLMEVDPSNRFSAKEAL